MVKPQLVFDSMLITVKAHPKSKELKFLWKENVLYAYLTEPADKNKANLQLIRELSKRYGSCKIVKGATSSKKMVEVPLSLKTLQNLI